jgi:hypothetical protein
MDTPWTCAWAAEPRRLCGTTRRQFEPFGGLRTAVNAARCGVEAEAELDMHRQDEGPSDPTYTPPKVLCNCMNLHRQSRASLE